ncbi:MAG: hypothetical protein QOJ12_3377, partial [Thermoleophilales bacterium]|nr:hypothetical protein [Thermoleophilales bacterium]
RALMVPPGIPEFMTRERFVRAGAVRLEGRAWSGWGPITRVEVSSEDGEWTDAELGDAPSPAAWRPWSHDWHPHASGRYELRCRASDAAGNTQPLDPPWNLGGYLNNSAQRVVVNVT